MDLKTSTFIDNITDAQAVRAAKLRMALTKLDLDIENQSVDVPPDLEDTATVETEIVHIEKQIRTAQADHTANFGRSGEDYVAAVGPLKEARNAAKTDLQSMQARNAARMVDAQQAYNDRVAALTSKRSEVMEEIKTMLEGVTWE